MGTRDYWVSILKRLATPLLEASADGRLSRDMPLRHHPARADGKWQDDHSHLEAFARLLAGIAPWLGCCGLTGEEARLQERLRSLALQSLVEIANPNSPDYLLKGSTAQYLVDAAFLAQGVLRARKTLWEPLDHTTQTRIFDGLLHARSYKPPWTNWLCFSAMCEIAIGAFGGTPDTFRIETCLRAHERFFKGDGTYGDGEFFAWDYYNGYVIHPMLLEILDGLPASDAGNPSSWENKALLQRDESVRRAQRYALIQERLIAPDGSFPPVGRSITYRMGAFQALGLMALRHQVPEELPPAQIRCALTAVLRRLMEAPGTWDEGDWLQIGLCGHQPGLGEFYISTGSLYLCAAGLLPLGLPPGDPFWSDPDQPWTSVRIFGGDDLPADHAW